MNANAYITMYPCPEDVSEPAGHGLRPLYMDVQATTPLVRVHPRTQPDRGDIVFLSTCMQDPRVLDAMLPYLTSLYGNPHSRTHAYGWETEAAVERARKVKPSGMLLCGGYVDCSHLLYSKWRT